MTTKHTPGDTVYNHAGHAAELAAVVDGEYLVRPIYEDDEGGSRLGDVRTWRTVFKAPPAPKIDAKTAEAEKRLSEVMTKLHAAEAMQREFDRTEKARLERIKQHEALADLDRYLAGEVTHYVAVREYGFGLAIIPISETIENYYSASEYGLLKLMPSTGWDKKVRWSVYYKPKNSGGDSRTERVHLCCGEDAAKEKAS